MEDVPDQPPNSILTKQLFRTTAWRTPVGRRAGLGADGGEWRPYLHSLNACQIREFDGIIGFESTEAVNNPNSTRSRIRIKTLCLVRLLFDN